MSINIRLRRTVAGAGGPLRFCVADTLTGPKGAGSEGSCRTACLAACILSVVSLAGCGGGSGSGPPPLPVSVGISSADTIVEAGATVQLQAAVTNSTDQSVTWAVTQPAGTGTISTSGLYSAPAAISSTTDVTITATAHADATKMATEVITVFATPRIGARMSNGAAELFDRGSGLRFVPRGNNYLHFSSNTIRLQDQAVGYGRTTLAVGFYDPQRSENALAAMEAQGYNVVRTFLDVLIVGDIGNESGTGLDPKYIANLADFMTRADAHHILILPVFEELPYAGGYRGFISGNLQAQFGTYNVQFLTQPGIDATRRFWQDLFRGLVAAHAPMDAILAFELTGEFYIDNSAAPLTSKSGLVQTANGSSYDMANPVARVAMQNDGMVFYAARMADAIHALQPDALTTMGFFTYNGTNPAPFPAIENSTVDFIDLHGWPDLAGTTIAQLVSGWQINGFRDKPIIMGEFDAFTNVFATPAAAAAGLKSWQIASCAFGFSGWLLWTWDTEPNELPGLSIWSALSGNGEINSALAPVVRPDPCVS